MELQYRKEIDGFELSPFTDLIIEGAITYSDRRHISYNGEKIFGQRLINNLSGKGYSSFKNAE